MDVFRNPEDGDFHVHILVDDKYRKSTNGRICYIPVCRIFTTDVICSADINSSCVCLG